MKVVKVKEPAAEPIVHAGHKIPRIWIVVADRKAAQIYRRTPQSMVRIADAAPGHDHESAQGGSLHHHTDARDRAYHHGEAHFVQDLAAWLAEAAQDNQYDRLVLVAPPSMLGDLRQALSTPVHTRVMAEISKDLTKLPAAELEEALSEIVWF